MLHIKLEKIKQILFLHHWQITLGVWWALVLFSAAVAHKFVSYAPSFPYYQMLVDSQLPAAIYGWANFDGVHYLNIAKHGYEFLGLVQAFFPAFPITLMALANNNIGISILISWAIGIFALTIIRKLFITELGELVGHKAWLALLFFPTSFFIIAVYSEGLFLLLLGLSLLAAKQKKWWQAGAWAAIASGTRIVGVFLLIVLALETWRAYHEKNQSYQVTLNKIWADRRQVVGICLSPIGWLLYSLYLAKAFADPLLYFHVQAEFGSGRQEAIILYPQVVWRATKILLTVPSNSWKYWAYWQEWLVGMASLPIVLMTWFNKKIPVSWIFFSVIAIVLPTLTGTFSSLPRYILPALAVFAYLGVGGKKHPQLFNCWLVISTILLILNVMLFIQGRWVA